MLLARPPGGCLRCARHGAFRQADIPDGAEWPGAGTGAGSLAHAARLRAAALCPRRWTAPGPASACRREAARRCAAGAHGDRAAIRAAHPLCATGAAATGTMRARPASAASGRSARVPGWPRPTTCLPAGARRPNLGRSELEHWRAGQLLIADSARPDTVEPARRCRTDFSRSAGRARRVRRASPGRPSPAGTGPFADRRHQVARAW
jgi:hypothetical protein